MVTNDIDIEIKAFNLLVKINRWSVNWEITTALSFSMINDYIVL